MQLFLFHLLPDSFSTTKPQPNLLIKSPYVRKRGASPHPHSTQMFKELNIRSERTFNTDSYSSVKLKISTHLSGERFFSILLQNRNLSKVYFLNSFNFQNLKDFHG